MRWKVCASSVMVLMVLAGSSYYARQHEVTFDKLHAAKTRLAALGYHCTTDSANGQIGSGFLISRSALGWNEVGTLCKSGPMGPEWQGKVWVTLNPDNWRLEAVPDEAGVRVWGAVLAFGDEAFLNEIEEAF